MNTSLNAAMLLLIELILFLVLLYSAAYMMADAHLVSFFALLNAFAASMLLLIIADS